MKTNAIFYHAGCPVCVAAEQQLADAKHLDPQEYERLQGLVRYSGVQLAVKRRKR